MNAESPFERKQLPDKNPGVLKEDTGQKEREEGVRHEKDRKMDGKWQGGKAETDFILPAKSVSTGNGKVKSCSLQPGGLP